MCVIFEGFVRGVEENCTSQAVPCDVQFSSTPLKNLQITLTFYCRLFLGHPVLCWGFAGRLVGGFWDTPEDACWNEEKDFIFFDENLSFFQRAFYVLFWTRMWFLFVKGFDVVFFVKEEDLMLPRISLHASLTCSGRPVSQENIFATFNNVDNSNL